MKTDGAPRAHVASAWTLPDVRAILTERGWCAAAPDLESGHGASAAEKWMADAAAWLGPYAADRAALAELLSLVFRYDARKILASADAHSLLLRAGARDAIRALAIEVLEGPAVNSARFSEIISAVKRNSGVSGRTLFYAIRLALAGRTGEGGLDRVILLLDAASAAPDLAPVKSARERMLEFCAALD